MLGRSRADSCQMIGCTAICRLATSTFKGIGCCPGPTMQPGTAHPPEPPQPAPGATQRHSPSNGWVPFLQLHQNPIWVRPSLSIVWPSDE